MMGAITDFLGSGTTSVVLKLTLLFGLGIGFFLLTLWLKKQEIAKARQDEGEKAIKDQQDLTKENKKENEEAKTDSGAVDDFLKGEKQ
jgi:hypothetical protein